MHRFINDEIEELINGVEMGGNTAQLNTILKNQDFSNKMNKINKTYNSIINNIQYYRCLLILSLKKVTWNRELRDKFNISKYSIERFIYYMEQNGFIINKMFVDLDNVLYETLLNTNPKDMYKDINKIHLLTLSPEGEEFAKKIINDSIKLTGRSDIINALKDIQQKTKAFKLAYNNVLEKENKLGDRYVFYPDGTLIKKKTERKRRLQLDIRKAFIEYKKELIKEKQEIGLINSQQANELIIKSEGELACYIDENKKSNGNISYSGKYSNLSSKELEKVMNCELCVDEEAGSTFIYDEKEYNKQLKERVKNLNNSEETKFWSTVRCNGYHDEEQVRENDVFNLLGIENETI